MARAGLVPRPIGGCIPQTPSIFTAEEKTGGPVGGPPGGGGRGCTLRSGRRPQRRGRKMPPSRDTREFFRWQNDQYLPLCVRRHIREPQDALSLLRAHLPERQQPAEPSISCAVGREAQDVRCVFDIEASADDQTQPHLFGRDVRAHDTGEGVAIGDRECRKPQRLCLRDEFLRVGTASQEGEIRRRLQFGVGGRWWSPMPHPSTPCMNQTGLCGPAASFSSSFALSRSSSRP